MASQMFKQNAQNQSKLSPLRTDLLLDLFTVPILLDFSLNEQSEIKKKRDSHVTFR
jgi:hypothetical protein